MFGNNPKRAPRKHDGEYLWVKNIFKTLQGEGPNVGQVSVFIRLGGCNLACSFCDTQFEEFVEKNIEDIIQQVDDYAQEWKNFRDAKYLVVITGGEPFLQNIAPLCRKLLDKNYRVQIETNGTIYRPVDKEVEIICSPKASQIKEGKIKYFPLRQDVLENITALKFIISAHLMPYNDVPDIGQNSYNIPHYIQPMDECDNEKNHKNTQRALEIALRNGYNLSIQMHKILEIE